MWTIDTSNPEIATRRLTKPRFELCPRRWMSLKAQLPTGCGNVVSTRGGLTSQTGDNQANSLDLQGQRLGDPKAWNGNYSLILLVSEIKLVSRRGS